MANRTRTDWVVVHCSATTPTMDIGMKEIDGWHRTKGWDGIGYHRVIRRNGAVEQGRRDSRKGAHVAGHNHDSYAIVLVGGIDAAGKPEMNFTPAQMKALATELRRAFDMYPGAKLRGHRDFPGVAKACPSFSVREWWADRD